jgi:hypothetical protein
LETWKQNGFRVELNTEHRRSEMVPLGVASDGLA